MKLVLKNVIKLAKGSLNYFFQDSFNKILSQQFTHDRSYISHSQESEHNLLYHIETIQNIIYFIT